MAHRMAQAEAGMSLHAHSTASRSSLNVMGVPHLYGRRGAGSRAGRMAMSEVLVGAARSTLHTAHSTLHTFASSLLTAHANEHCSTSAHRGD